MVYFDNFLDYYTITLSQITLRSKILEVYMTMGTLQEDREFLHMNKTNSPKQISYTSYSARRMGNRTFGEDIRLNWRFSPKNIGKDSAD